MTAFELAGKLSLDSSGFTTALNKQESSFKKFGTKLVKTASKVGKIAMATVGAGAVMIGKASVQEGLNFDKAMSQVAATLGKSKEEIADLSKFAREMGSKTAFSATEAAEALNYMALAGYDSEKSMKMLPTVLNLAAAGNIDLAKASDMVTDAQSALGLSIEDTERMVDQMAKTSSKTNTSVEQLGDAFLTVGGTAKMMGKGGIDATTELSMALGVLADNGIKGAEGGTMLRNVLLSLSAPTDKAAKRLKKLGVDIFDSSGEMRDLPFILQDINEATKDMTDAERTDFLSEVFNKRDLKAIEALLGTDMSRWEELYNEIGHAEGSAEKMAETQLDNLAGDLTIFKSALSEAKLTISDKLSPTLRKFVQRATTWVGRLTTAFGEKGFAGVAEESGKIIQEGIDYLKNSDSPVLQKVGNALQWVKDITGKVKNLLTNFPETIASMKESESPTIRFLGNALEGVQTAFNTVKGLIEDFPGTVASMKESDSPAIQALGLALDGIQEAFNLVGQLVEDFPGTISSMKESDSPLLNALAEVLSLISDGFTSVIQIINGDYVGAIRTLKSSDSEIAQTIGEVADAFDSARQRVEEFVDASKEAFGVSGSGGKLYTSYAEKMGHLFSSDVTDEASMKSWLGELKKGLQEAGMEADNIDTVLHHFERMGPEADSGGVMESLKQLADNPYGIDQLLGMWKSLDAYYDENPLVIEEKPEVDEAQLAEQIAETQEYLDNNPLMMKIILSEFDPNSALPQGSFVSIPGNAKGLWSVPEDNYLTRLHRDEMVLTASQARQYREGKTGNNNSEVVEAIQSLKNAMANLQLVVGRKSFGRAVVNYGGNRMNNYIGSSESRLAAGYGT